MKRIHLIAALTVTLCFLAAEAWAQSPAKKPAAKGQAAYRLPDTTAVQWTGDLDGMIKRRMIRVLVTYNKTHYFADRGTQRGVAYDAFRLFEDDLNKKLKRRHIRVHVIFVAVSRDDLLPALLEGRGDIAAANLTITPERLRQTDFSNPVNTDISEIVVTGPGASPVASVEDLSDKEIYVRKSSSFYESLQKLNADLTRAGKAPVKVRLASENLEMEDILEMTNAGLVKITIADSHIAGFWKKVLRKITLHPEAAIRTGGSTGFMIRKNSPLLKEELNAFLARYPEESARRNLLLQKYLKSTKFVKEATSKEEMAKFERSVEFFRKYGDAYDMDYMLMIAQGYQESRLNQKVRSPVGAIGVMQVMPATGKEMNVGDITRLEPNIHAGVKYIRFMVNRYFENEPMDRLNKGLFAFAAYNAGPARISRLRRLASKRGLNPNVWFNNVELIAAEKIGRETVTYVSNIHKYYIAYSLIAEEWEERKRALEELRNKPGSK
ncbi:MAG: transporter substrate-binding domain-containing protein [Syntrophaceae bacterium]|nr:transporter substrate-binding domain-containing protein [Syntrophaceae bacterium]